MAKLFFTWVGAPGSTREIKGIEGAQRQDLFGCVRTHRARYKGEKPEITLCVLKKFAQYYRAQLPDSIAVLSIEDVFSTSKYLSLIMSKPDLSNLDMCVDYIIRETLGVRGSAYDNALLPKKRLAFVKDVWSLYCVWRFGGYHLDLGCFPYSEPVEFPEPKIFGVPDIQLGLAAARRDSQAILAGVRTRWVAMPNGSDLEQTVFAGKISDTQASPLGNTVDVWLVRSPAKDASVKKALEAYILGWFEIERYLKQASVPVADGTQRLYLRQLIISAVFTGMTYNGNTRKQKAEAESHLIKTYMRTKIPELGINKVNFGSHR